VSGGPSVQLRVGRRQAAGKNWRVIAACPFVDPELFFPISTAGKCLEQVAEAKQVCARCLVQAECLTFAQQTGQAHGIWGGLTEEERIQAVRSRHRGTPPLPAAPRQPGSSEPGHHGRTADLPLVLARRQS
jgi:WhiB family transcriptional regulator, redox-sensing transcriptional regulator